MVDEAHHATAPTYAEQSTADWGKESYGTSPYWSYKWGYAWDDKHYAAQVLLARITCGRLLLCLPNIRKRKINK